MRGGRLALALRAAAFVVPMVLVGPARGQLAASISAETDDQYRGVSLSGHKPDVSLNLSYDDPRGVYAAVSAVVSETPSGGVEMLGYLASVGYSARLNTRLAWDAGLTDAHLVQDYSTHGFHYRRTVDDPQAYVGLITKHVSARVYYSPDYFNQGQRVLYGEIDAAVRPARRWRLFGHAGAATPLGGGGAWPGARRETYDLRAGAAAERDHWEARLYWTTALPYAEYPPRNPQNSNALVLGASWFF
jgi:hypothetical protein